MDDQPAQAIWRGLLGFLLAAVGTNYCANDVKGACFLLVLLATLVLLRIVPALIRHLVKFPPGLVAVWMARRQLAKRFDSYQWRKVLWMGVGMGLYFAINGVRQSAHLMIATFCLLGGSLGGLAWRRRTVSYNST